MKRLLSVVLVILLLFTLTSCGGNNTTSGSNEGNKEMDLDLDLSGGWKQRNSNSNTDYQIAMIDDGTIEIYWKDDDGTSLYWAGTYEAPSSESNEYTWESINDRSRTDSALFASGDDTKAFKHKNGVISYSVSALGVTTTVELERSEDVNIQVQKAVAAEDLLPLEMIDSGYFVKDGYDTFYIQYAIIVKNPNTERAVEFPKVRITARDTNGEVLGTEDIVGSSILPGETWYSAFQGPSIDSKPEIVEFEIIQPSSGDWVLPDRIDNVGTSLSVEKPTKREDKIVGEIFNPNNFDINSVAVVVLFRDDTGNLIAGETTYTDKINAGGKIPFELSLWGAEEYITDNFEVYAYPWY
jgi:hypothetical protein